MLSHELLDPPPYSSRVSADEAEILLCSGSVTPQEAERAFTAGVRVDHRRVYICMLSLFMLSKLCSLLLLLHLVYSFVCPLGPLDAGVSSVHAGTECGRSAQV